MTCLRLRNRNKAKWIETKWPHRCAARPLVRFNGWKNAAWNKLSRSIGLSLSNAIYIPFGFIAAFQRQNSLLRHQKFSEKIQKTQVNRLCATLSNFFSRPIQNQYKTLHTNYWNLRLLRFRLEKGSSSKIFSHFVWKICFACAENFVQKQPSKCRTPLTFNIENSQSYFMMKYSTHFSLHFSRNLIES